MQNVGIEGKLKELLKEIDEDIDTEMITGDSLLKEDVGLSSVAMLYMAVSIENEFGVDLSDANLKNMKTVEDVIQLISDRL
ncbi:MAG: acyl carrier protein [Parasporobacterium sp.]|nr:acyl carrier protein [Parasporobacterium sp.]MBR3642474.1 acyl carrier protein [Parasporobacterium sp.]